MELDFESLGFTREELQERVVSRMVDTLLGDADAPTLFQDGIESLVRDRIDAAVVAIGDKHVLPNIQDYVAQARFEPTNKWGEPKEPAMTLIEYLEKRAESYLTEQVNYKGEPRGRDGYNWKPDQTRVAHLVHEHIQYDISTAIQKALKTLNADVADGLAETVRIKLAQTLEKLKVDVKT